MLEGESLFNDATSLVTLKVAIAAIGATSVAWGPAVGQFAWAAGGGVLLGVVLGLALSFVRRHAGSPLTITALSLVTPFAAYLIGEEAHASGVLVVVVTGLVLGYRSPTEVAASVRLTEQSTWAALRFVLEGGVFALIGLELRGIVESLDTSTDNVFLAIGAVLLTVIVSRPIFVGLIHAVSRLTGRRGDHVGMPGVAAVSWAGMRGVVSLAAAQTLPLDTPYRSLLLVCTITVILGTLVLQGLSLPWVIRRLGITEDRRADDQRERAEALTRVSEEINARVDALVDDGRLSDRQAQLMRKWASLRDWRNWDDDEASRDFARRLSVLSDWRRALLGIEREVIVAMRNEGDLSENVLAEMQHDLDLEEALLERRTKSVDGHLGELPADDDPEGSGRPDLMETAPSGAERALDRDAAGSGPVDESVDQDAVIDDADVSALLMDEQRAEGTTIGQRSAPDADAR
jgi:CPA1 family monovalent cation:H+ antiporter